METIKSIEFSNGVVCKKEGDILICSGITKETALTSITALRHFNKKLDDDLKELYEDPSNYASSIESVKKFKSLVKNAYDELQDLTGDKTPLEL